MNLGELITMGRSRVPGAKSSVIDDDVIRIILNQGKDELCFYAKCLPVNEKFSTVASTEEYDLTSELTRYLMPQPSGLWWNAGSSASPNWQQLDAVTIGWLDKYKPAWRDASAGSPLYYYIEGDKANVHPKPTSSLTDGLWMYHYQKSADMSQDDDYPFGGSNEISRLSVFSEALLLYWEMRANFMINEEALALQAKQAYLQERGEKIALLNTRPDLLNSEKAIMSVPSIGDY